MDRRARLALFAAALLAAVAADTPRAWAAAAPKRPATRPISGVRHLIIISCDGMRPDVLLRAETPNFRKLMARGSFSLWARTIPIAITLPSHTSMLTGVYP